jgi:membrane protein YqaA with SNARE-associated domain
MSEIILWIFTNMSWMLLSIVKFLITPSVMVGAGYVWYEVILVSTLGASIGVMLFYFFGKLLFNLWNRHKSNLLGKKKKTSMPSSKKNRRVIGFKNRFGIMGLLLLSVLISVPISSVLAAKYFSNDRLVVLKLCAAFFCWSIVLTLGTHVVIHCF